MSSKSKKITILALILLIAVPSLYIGMKIVRYKAYIWLPTYLFDSHPNNLGEIRGGHVLFLMVDHHEPGPGERGIKISNEWCENYKSNTKGIKDDFGNPVQYTWFYPYDHLNSQVLFNLNELVFAGLGEVEFYWHLSHETNETFPPKLKDAVEWFNSHGCMLPIGLTPEPYFAFVAGNWALYNSSGKSYQCGVNRQLDILREYGCYADMTFSTVGTLAQPSKINSIYYAKDTDEPKSYNTGVDAEVGSPNSEFLIFQGPICFDWHDRIFECACFESTSPFKQHRVKLWLKYAPIVKGRPEWLFIKVYTHGAQSRDVILSEQFRDMCLELTKVCHELGLSLHYVTAREAFNMVKAAEQGLEGNPELYRDYLLKKPINRVMSMSCRIKNAIVGESKIHFGLIEPQQSSFSFRIGPIKTVSGFLSRYQFHSKQGESLVRVEGQGDIDIVSSTQIEFENELTNHRTDMDGQHIYAIRAIQ